MKKTILKRSVAILLSFAMLLAYAPGLAYLGVESSKTQAYAATKDSDWTYGNSGNVLTAEDHSGEASAVVDVATVKLVVSSKTFDGSAVVPTLNKDGWDDGKYLIPVNANDVTYTKYNGTDYVIPVDGAPTNVGRYRAALTVGGATAYDEFEITGKTPEYTAPTAKSGLKYNGGTQELINAGTVEGGKMLYSFNGPSAGTEGTYKETIPAGVKAGTYTVNYKSVSDDPNYAEISGTLNVTIDEATVPAKWYFFIQEGTENVINAMENGTDYGFEDQSVTLKTDNAMFTGDKYAGASVKLSAGWIPENNLELVDVDDIEYFEAFSAGFGTQWRPLNEVPSEVGSYKAVLTYKGYSAESEFCIYVNKSVIEKAPSAKELEYNGKDQVLVNAGGAKNGTMMYYVTETKGDVQSPIFATNWTWTNGWTKDLDSVTGLDAGTYYVYYGVQGTTGYNSYYNSDFVKVVIEPKAVNVVWEKTAYIYNGKNQLPTAHVETNDLVYADKVRLGGEEAEAFISDTFAKKDVNDKTLDGEVIKYRAKATGILIGETVSTNYVINSETMTAEWQIVPRHITVKVKNNLGKTYGDDGYQEWSKKVYDPYWHYGRDAVDYVKSGYVVVDNSKDKMPEDKIKDEISMCIEMDREFGEAVGTYKVTIDGSGIQEMKNYVVDEYIDGTYTITPRDIWVVADDKEKVYGEEDPALTYYTEGRAINKDGRIDPASKSGFVKNVTFTRQRPGEEEFTFTIDDSVKNSFDGNIERVTGEDVDTYAIKQGTLTSENYNINFEEGEFDITPRPIYANQVAWGGKSFRYDGYTHVRTATVVKSEDATGYAKRDGAFALNVAGAARNVGSYTVYASLPAAYQNNYRLVGSEVVSHAGNICFTNSQYIVANTLVAKAASAGSKKLSVSWDGVAGASSYVVYGAKCGKGMQYLGKAYGNAITVKKIGKKKLQNKKAYKFFVVALNSNGEVIAQSNEAHAIVKNIMKKNSNVTGIWASIAQSNLKVGESTVVRADQSTYKNKKWLGTKHGAQYRFLTSDSSVAVVDAWGNVTATGEGSCAIYVQAINGLWTTVIVNVTAPAKPA